MSTGEERIRRIQSLYANCDAKFSGAIERQEEAAERLAELRAEADSIRNSLHGIEFETLVNGGRDDVLIDGKNDQLRAAQLAIAAGKHPSFAGLQTELRKVTRSIAIEEGRLVTASNSASFEIARLGFLTELARFVNNPKYQQENADGSQSSQTGRGNDNRGGAQRPRQPGTGFRSGW